MSKLPKYFYFRVRATRHGTAIEVEDASDCDVVEVVRCKDCIYFDKYIDCQKMYQWDGFCADWARNTYENWYCSRAERRGDDGL